MFLAKIELQQEGEKAGDARASTNEGRETGGRQRRRFNLDPTGGLAAIDAGEALRVLLLEALVTYKTVRMDCFPASVRDLVAASRAQADALCLRILETNAVSGRSIEHEVKEVCRTLTCLEAAMKNMDEQGEPKGRRAR